MEEKFLIHGLQHIGIEIDNVEVSEKFYAGLGFDKKLKAIHDIEENLAVVFVEKNNLLLELYETKNKQIKAGHINHIAIEVQGLCTLHEKLTKNKYNFCQKEISYLPFWEKGINYFSIYGQTKK